MCIRGYQSKLIKEHGWYATVTAGNRRSAEKSDTNSDGAEIEYQVVCSDMYKSGRMHNAQFSVEVELMLSQPITDNLLRRKPVPIVRYRHVTLKTYRWVLFSQGTPAMPVALHRLMLWYALCWLLDTTERSQRPDDDMSLLLMTSEA